MVVGDEHFDGAGDAKDYIVDHAGFAGGIANSLGHSLFEIHSPCVFTSLQSQVCQRVAKLGQHGVSSVI